MCMRTERNLPYRIGIYFVIATTSVEEAAVHHIVGPSNTYCLDTHAHTHILYDNHISHTPMYHIILLYYYYYMLSQVSPLRRIAA